MLTIIGRAAGRRAVTPAMTMMLPIRSVQQARTFITTPVVFEAAEKVDKPKKASGEKKTTKKSKPGPGRPKTGEKRKPRIYVKKTPEELEASYKKAAEKRVKTNQKKTKQAAKDKNILLLKQALLDAPLFARRINANPYNIFCRIRRAAGDDLSTAAKKWKAISDAEKEALTEEATQEKEQLRRKYYTWVESQPVEAIALANQARKALNAKRKEAGKKEKYDLFEDPRLPTANILTSLNFFIRDRTKGHYGAPITGTLVAATAEWKTMTDTEKQPYVTIAAGEKEKVLRQREELAAKVKVLKERYKADPEVPEDAESA